MYYAVIALSALLSTAAVIAHSVTCAEQVQTQDNPFIGTWVADLARSKRHPDNEFKSWTLEFAVKGNTVTSTNRIVTSVSQEQGGVNTFLTNGEEHPSEQNPAVMFSARWVNPRILEVVSRFSGRSQRVTYEVSVDGQALTARIPFGKDANGADFEQVIVFNRQ